MVRQPDILDRLGALLDRLAPYLIFALFLMAAVGVASAQDMMRVVRGGWRREAAAPVSPYWTDPYTNAWWPLETTNESQTLDIGNLRGIWNASNYPNVATGPTPIIVATNSLGRIKHGYDFDGSVDAFVGTNIGHILSSNFTVSVLVNLDTISGNNDGIFCVGNFNTAYTIAMLSAADIRWRPNAIAGGEVRVGIPSNTWIRLTGTYDGKVSKLYTNEFLAGQTAYAAVPNHSTYKPIIGGYYAPTYVTDGKIADVALYTNCLTAEEVTNMVRQCTVTNYFKTGGGY